MNSKLVSARVAAHFASRIAVTDKAYDGYVAAKDEYRSPTIGQRFDRAPTRFLLTLVFIVVSMWGLGEYFTHVVFPWFETCK